LADPARAIDAAWDQRDFGPATEFRAGEVDGRHAIRAVGQERSASGLYRQIGYDLAEHPILEWHWRVDELQPSADLSRQGRDDFGAAILLIFQQGVWPFDRTEVLGYIWTAERAVQGSVIRPIRHPHAGRYLVLQAGVERLGEWVLERRNVLADYQRAFGRPAPSRADVLVLFSDNDQTGEPVTAY
jgi:hypothetical protein